MIQEGGKETMAPFLRQKCFLDLDLHTDTNNSAPNEYRGVVNSSGLVVYKGSTQEIKVQGKVKTKSKLSV